MIGFGSVDEGRKDRYDPLVEWVGYRVLAVPALVLLLALFVYPLSDLFLRSLQSPEGPFARYLAVLTDPYSRHYFANTIAFACATAVATAALGYPLALLMASVPPRVVGVLLLLVLIPFWTSVLVRSYAWIVILGRRGLLNSGLISLGLVEEPLPLLFNSTGVLIGMIHIMLPYMVLMVFSVLVKINRDVLLAADSLGARPLQVVGRVLLPLTMPGVAAGAVVIFALSLGFFVTPALMGGPRDVVAAMEIRELVTHKLAWEDAAAVSALLLLIKAGTLVAAMRILALRRRLAVAAR